MSAQAITLIASNFDAAQNVAIVFEAEQNFDLDAMLDYETAYGQAFFGWDTTDSSYRYCDMCGGMRPTSAKC